MKRGLLEPDIKVKVSLARCQWNIQVTKKHLHSLPHSIVWVHCRRLWRVLERANYRCSPEGRLPCDILSTHCCFGNRSSPPRYSSWAQDVIVMTAIIIIVEVAVKERGSSEMPKMSLGNESRFRTQSMDVNRGSFLKMAACLPAMIRRWFIASECLSSDKITRPLMVTLFTAKTWLSLVRFFPDWLKWEPLLVPLIFPWISLTGPPVENVLCQILVLSSF